MSELTVERVLVAIAERSARQRIANDIAGVLTSVHAGQRLSAVADRLVHVAATAQVLVDELGDIGSPDIGSPDTDRPPMADALAAEARRVRAYRRARRPISRVEPRAVVLRTRGHALLAAGAPIVERKDALGLPLIADAGSEELDQWEALIIALEVEHLDTGRPFTVDEAEKAA